DAAANQDALGRRGQHQVVEGEGQGLDDLVPDGIGACQLVAGEACTGLDRRTRGQALDTVAVVGTDAGPGASGPPGDTQMPDLAVAQAPDCAPVDDRSDADAGADGDIGEGAQALGAAPGALGQGCAVDVGVEADGDREPPRSRQQVRPAPARLGR